jgi:hypothetical protein
VRLDVRTVAHVIGEGVKALAQLHAKIAGHFDFVERAIHAPEPFVALTRADGEWQMPGTEARMTIAFDVRGRAPRPKREIEVELFPRGL